MIAEALSNKTFDQLHTELVISRIPGENIFTSSDIEGGLYKKESES